MSVACFCLPAGASAAVTYAADLHDAPGFAAAGGRIELSGLDSGKSLKVEIGPSGGPATYSATELFPSSTLVIPFTSGIAGGDEISIWQPSGAASPTTVLNIADPALFASGGTVSGDVPAGMTGSLVTDSACGRASTQHAGLSGHFEFVYPGFTPGVFQTLSVSDSAGDSVTLTNAAAGETPCFQVNSSSATRSFHVAATHLTGSPIESSLLTLKRDGTELLSVAGDGTGAGGAPSATPRAGDVLELTTPEGTYSQTLPAIDSSFDPDGDIVTVEAPAASSLRADPVFAGLNFRTIRDSAAGVSAFDFTTAGDGFAPLDLAQASVVAIDYTNPSNTLQFVVGSARLASEPTGSTGSTGPPVDVPPVQNLGAKAKLSVTLAGSISVASLKKRFARGLKLKIRCNVRAKYSLALAFTGLKPVKLASARGQAIAGTGSATLKFTRSGASALRALKRSRVATLSIRTTDTAGRVTTANRRIRIKP